MLYYVIDDLRSFDPAPPEGNVLYSRSSAAALMFLRSLKATGVVIGELWLDHDLGGTDTIMPVVDWLCEQSFRNRKAAIDKIWVHTANSSAAPRMIRTLDNYNYNVSPGINSPLYSTLIYDETLLNLQIERGELYD